MPTNRLTPSLNIDAAGIVPPGTIPSEMVSFCMDSTSFREPCAVVLAAGKGTRMQSDLPKVLCPVVGRLTTNPGIEIDFVEQTEQLGTGHSVQMCATALQHQTGPTIVVAGDSPLIQSDSLKKLLAHLAQSKPSLLLGTLKKDHPTGLGRIVRGPEGDFLGIVEHKDATEDQLKVCEVNMSTYLFQTDDLLEASGRLGHDNAQGEYYLTDCATLLRESGKRVEALPVLQQCESLSINNPDELEMVDQAMRAMGYA